MTPIRPIFCFLILKFITFTALLGNNYTSLYKFKAYTTTVLIDMCCEMIATEGSVNIHLLIHHFLISWIMLWVLHKTLEDSHISSWVMLILMPLNKIGTVTLFFFTFFYWSIVTLHCYVYFCCTAKWISHMYTHIPSFFNFFPI